MQLATITPHPVFTPADLATMSASERAYFTDEPCAHAAAHEDFRRQRAIEARNAATARLVMDRNASRVFA